VRVNVRVIAATNQDLEAMVEERKFRADLYYRLNIFPIALPPLREREEDIPLLVAHFVRKFADRAGKSIDSVPDDVMDALRRHHWPGNIRELQNFIERSIIMATDSVFRPNLEQLPPPLASRLVRTLADAERAHILATLRETNGVVGGARGAAARLGLPRTTLIAKMQKLGLSREAPQLAEDDQGHAPAFHSHRAWGKSSALPPARERFTAAARASA